MVKNSKDKYWAWALTGSGHFFDECIDIISGLNRVDIFVSQAAEEVLRMYKKNNSLPRESRIFRDNTASAVPVGRFYQGIYHTLVMAPISSNTVAKCVYGISDNLATNVFAQAGKCRTYSICFACDTAPELESMAPKGMVKVFPRKIDLTNVKKLEKFKQTKVVDSMNGLKQEIEKREIWLKNFYS